VPELADAITQPAAERPAACARGLAVRAITVSALERVIQRVVPA